jgi:hypothetical protein
VSSLTKLSPRLARTSETMSAAWCVLQGLGLSLDYGTKPASHFCAIRTQNPEAGK